jgi:N4-(beta-N-acetylglucosaminyl)-L-asparaginase
MLESVNRREFVRAGAAAGVAAALPGLGVAPAAAAAGAPTVLVRRMVNPVVISDHTGFTSRDASGRNAVETAFAGIVDGMDVLDALMKGVNIPELDPEESGVGYGGLPNADGVVQLDASCMHGPKKRAGAVAAIEGVRTPSLVAQAVADHTDHHLLVGQGAQDFARAMGFTIEEDLNTPTSRRLWLEWKRRVDPDHWLDPNRRARAGLDAGLSMVRDGLIPEHSFWGTINCDGLAPNGDICGVTTTSGLSWKIPGRVGDSPILGAGLYVDNDVGAAGSTGRGEANLYGLNSFLIVENMRRGMSPKDAGIDALRRIRGNTVDARLLNDRGLPNFNVRFFALNKQAQWAGVALYASGETKFAVCDENGAREVDFEPLIEGSPAD